MREGVSLGIIAYIAAIVLFILAGLGVTVESVTSLELAFFGLAAFALGHIIP